MIWFLLIAGLSSVAVLLIVLAPMMRVRPVDDQQEPVSELFRSQLAGVAEEVSAGRLSPAEADAARNEIARRLLAAADRSPDASAAVAGRRSDAPWRFGAAIVIAGLLPAAALAVYFTVGAPAAINLGPNAAGPHETTDLAAAADKLKVHLQKAPDDLKGWIMFGRTLAALGRFGEARDAYHRALALAPDNAALHAEFGEVLVLEAQGKVTPSAQAEFGKAPEDARSRYYTAEAALQRGDAAAAKQQLQALLASAPSDAPWRQAVADRLAELEQNSGGAERAVAAPAAGGAPATTAPGPTAQDVAAAQSLSPEQRQVMIRGMVERLAQRLEQHPEDKAGWERLARAYDVLGQPDKAKAARARAAAAPADAAPASVPGASGTVVGK